MAFTPGQSLQGGRYTIEEKLGTGRFGITYRAKDRKGHPLVIKTLSDDVLSQGLSKPAISRLQDKFWQEATKLAKCRHPHIVDAKEPFREQGRVCIPMEYIPGKDLTHLSKPLSEKDALRYIQQIGEALTEVHRNGLLHRDVKPDNIMLRAGKAEAVLIDFGLAREFDQPLTTVNPTTADGFAPIELYDRDADRGPYTDVYSLAATLYVLLTGEMPPKSVERGKVQLKPPKAINPQISDRVNDAILKGMALEAIARPQTMQAWLDLLELRSDDSVTSDNSGDSPKPIDWDKRQTVIAIVSIVVTVVVTVVIGLWAQELKSWLLNPFSRPAANPSPTAIPEGQTTPNKPVAPAPQK